MLGPGNIVVLVFWRALYKMGKGWESLPETLSIPVLHNRHSKAREFECELWFGVSIPIPKYKQ